MQHVRAGIAYFDVVLGNAVGLYLVNAVENADTVGIMHHQVADGDIRKGTYLLTRLFLRRTLAVRMHRSMRKHRELYSAVFDTSAESSRDNDDSALDGLFGVGGEVGLEALVLQVACKRMRSFFST